MAGTKPLSDTPEAVRQRKHRERLAELKAANANVTSPSHETQPIDGSSPEEFSAVPVLDADSDNPRPLVPPVAVEEPQPGQPGVPAPSLCSPEEAAMFGQAVAAYFELGSGVLLAKRPELGVGLVQMSGTVEDFRKHFKIAKVFVAKCATECALKYNLRIPYMIEGVTIGAIALASYGLASQPSAEGKKQMDAAAREQRAANVAAGVPADAKNANGASNGHTNGHNPVPPPITTDGSNPDVEEELVL